MENRQSTSKLLEYEKKENEKKENKDTKKLPQGLLELLRNPVYVTMVVGWIFGSYLVGGYGTYLPKYLETQYGQTSSMADIYAGIISIGSVAVSTAVGGFLLSKFNIGPRDATLYLVRNTIITWFMIMVTYLLGMINGCVQPHLQGEKLPGSLRWDFSTGCNDDCNCADVLQFDPVCDLNGTTFFSPCHAGCEYEFADRASCTFLASSHSDYSKSWPTFQWENCLCANNAEKNVEPGWCDMNCGHLPVYLAIMFVGLFIGNLFFMTTMMVILRCIRDEFKSLGLSLASCLTNIFGFIPSPIIFGSIIDTSCVAWHSLCPHETGNCILYDNKDFRHKYHLVNAGFQLIAVLAVSLTYIKSRSFVFPEEEDYKDSRNPSDFSDDEEEAINSRSDQFEDDYDPKIATTTI